MASVDDLLQNMAKNPAGVRFTDACSVARHFFGKERISGSHYIWHMRWPGDPRVNLQKGKGNLAKAYQVKQLLAAVERARAHEPKEEERPAPEVAPAKAETKRSKGSMKRKR